MFLYAAGSRIHSVKNLARSRLFGSWYRRTTNIMFEHPKVVDRLVVLVVLMVETISLPIGFTFRLSPELALVVLSTLSLLWRRNHPVAVCAFVSSCYLIQAFGFTYFGIQPFLAIYALIVYGRTRLQVGVGSAFVVLVLLVADVPGARHAGDPISAWWLDMSIQLALVIGVADRTEQRRRYLAEMEEKMRWLETDRQRAASVAAQKERTRIARELHDVVAHSVSVMLIQATAAKSVLTTSSEESKKALTNIETSGREALTDLRQVLGLLRASDQPDYSPTPMLDKVPDLIAKTQASGNTITYTIDDLEVPNGMQSTIYRIIQEALTNVIKHAGTENVNVSIAVNENEKEIEIHIIDDGQGASPEWANQNGHGLIGIQERVKTYGGLMHAGPHSGGGFEIKASLVRYIPTNTGELS